MSGENLAAKFFLIENESKELARTNPLARGLEENEGWRKNEFDHLHAAGSSNLKVYRINNLIFQTCL